MDAELTELVKAIRNRCDIYLTLCVIRDEDGIMQRIIPTLLEDLHEDSQTIMDKYCIEKQND